MDREMMSDPGSAVDRVERSEREFEQLRNVNEQLIVAALRAQTAADLAERMLLEVARTSGLDELTGLPNLALMFDRFVQAEGIAARHANGVALMFLDIDRFKHINDTLGHAVGDEVLRRFAAILMRCTRSTDTVSRQGGDEFLILLSDPAHEADVDVIAAKIHGMLAEPMILSGNTISVSASIGVSLFPDHGTDLPVLIERADAAMYKAKRRGTGGVVYHNDLALAADGMVSVSDWHTQSKIDTVQTRAEVRHAEMQDANEHLVMAALTAQSRTDEVEITQRRQTDFIGLLAHELRNPLGPMRNVAAVLAAFASDNPALVRLQAVMERQVLHMARLVDDLLDVSRMNTGKLRLAISQVDMFDVVIDSVAACRASLTTHRQAFVSELPPEPVMLMGDPIRLTQIVTNLIDNASKFTPDDGSIRLSLEVEGAWLVLTVCDDGIGIPAESLTRIFNLYEQDALAPGSGRVGLGIGLSVVHDLVVAHGGTVEARSAGAGLGSQFVVTLPLLQHVN
jgi:diguanylate cyclase